MISDDECDERVRASYRGNYPRLAAEKKRCDPSNLYRVNKNQNQNIRPH